MYSGLQLGSVGHHEARIGRADSGIKCLLLSSSRTLLPCSASSTSSAEFKPLTEQGSQAARLETQVGMVSRQMRLAHHACRQRHDLPLLNPDPTSLKQQQPQQY